LSSLSVGDEHKNTDGRELQSCFRTLKSGRLFSLPAIASIRVGVQIDLELVGFAAALAAGPINP